MASVNQEELEVDQANEPSDNIGECLRGAWSGRLRGDLRDGSDDSGSDSSESESERSLGSDENGDYEDNHSDGSTLDALEWLGSHFESRAMEEGMWYTFILLS